MSSTTVRPFLLALVLVAGAGLPLVGCERIESAILDRAARQVTLPDHDEWLDDGALHVILCGTGSPVPTRGRASACTAVIAGGHFLLVDVGPGSQANVGLWRLPRARLDGILLTHFHSDHIGELGEAALQSWAWGRSRPLPVWGPPGVEQVVAGFEAAYALDTRYRVEHHGAEAMPPDARPLEARTVVAPERGGVVVFDDGELRVVAFAVDHAPVRPAYGYRFDFRGRSVLVSGDTAKSANLEQEARGVDVLVHEALAARLTEAGRRALEAVGLSRRAKLAGDIPGYHTTPVEAAEIARASGARMLVLTHLVPAPSNVVARRLFLRGVDEAWDGDVRLGEDGMHLLLPAGSEEIRVEQLE